MEVKNHDKMQKAVHYSGGSIDVVVLEEIGRAGTVRLDMAGLRAFVEAAL